MFVNIILKLFWTFLRCKYSQKCQPFKDYTQINSNDQLDLKGGCITGCHGDDISYQYYIYSLNSSPNQWAPFTLTKYIFTTGLDLLTLNEDIFSDHSSIIIWKIEFEVHISSRNVSGKSSILFSVNFPPRFGDCTVNPENGTTQTLFGIKCGNWIDLEGSVFYFAFYGKFVSFKINLITVTNEGLAHAHVPGAG